MIHRTYTLDDALVRIILVFTLLGYVVGTIDRSELPYLYWSTVVAGVVLGVYVLWVWYTQKREVALRPEKIKTFAATNSLSYEAESEIPIAYTLAEFGNKDVRVKNVIRANGWLYADYSYAIYRNETRVNYKAEEVHYSVIEVDLPRKLPHLVFDSPKAHKKQFSRIFNNTQTHSLEGNFDKHFTTYFPKHYPIDSLSIISPEVMQAMIDADEFDIEISGDKLFLYGPLIPVSTIHSSVDKALHVKDKLLNNIKTYRDERLPFKDGRKDVSEFGAKLRPNMYRGLPAVAFGVLLCVIGILSLQSYPEYSRTLWVLGAICMIMGGIDIRQARVKATFFEKRYQSSHGASANKSE